MNYKNIELEGIDANGNLTKTKLADLKGKNIILYFYPQDETPICTKEARNFRDALKKLPEDTVIIGVSPDNIESHKQFFEKHNLNFEILSDTEQKLAKAFKNVTETVDDKMDTLKENIKDKFEDVKDIIQDKKVEMKKRHEMKKEKEMENRPVTMRSTFIIGKDGNLLKEMRNIDIQGHVDEIIDYVQTL